MTKRSFHRPRRWAVLAILVVGSSGGCGGDKPAPAPPAAAGPTRPTTPRSLVVVDLSGVRYDETTQADDAGHEASLPSVFRALSKEGALFTQATASAAWDAPSIAGLFSGLSPDQCTVQGRPADGQRAMIPAIETLAEMLSEAGYATAAFTAGARIDRRSGLAQGFSTWEEIADDRDRLAKAVTWLEGPAKGVPHLLFFHATVPSGTGAVDLEFRRARLSQFESLVWRLKEASSDGAGKDGGWFVVLSDHGDVLSKREGFVDGKDPGAGGLDAGDTGTLDAQIRVPLAVVGPGFRPGPFDASVSLLDVVPTIRDLIGLPPPSLCEGRSWKPILDAPTSRGRPALSQAWRRAPTSSNPMKQRLVSVRTAAVKFTAEFDLGSGVWTEALFDLVADPREEHPLAAGDVTKHGEDFARSVALVRDALAGRKKIYDDPITSAYVHTGGGGGGLGTK